MHLTVVSGGKLDDPTYNKTWTYIFLTILFSHVEYFTSEQIKSYMN